ncbi:trihelix transcription factor ASR3 isoform X2 [Oryza glaberrima]|uniref:trihelix transcription factor ASR3 isoform X2 n=1 Tax=Oryza glaberrima TaxID=4538 RepID=UPI00224C4AA1|nr:trihelix transcription factor ASR3 isoform X2 [Oryza glaberrima]
MAMDPDAAEWPCIIQALPALPPSPSSTGVPRLPTMVQALPAATDPPPAAAAAARLRRGAEPPSPRRTRSGGAPEWTPAETLALVAEVAAVDDGWSRSVSAFQKWAIVAENLAASRGRAARGRGRGRAASECRRRWEALAAEYGVVRRWEVRGAGGYWRMSAAARRKAGLPADFDAEVYGAMEALTLVEEALLADATAGAGGAEIGEKSAAAAEVGEGDEVEAGEEDGNGDRGEVGEEDEGEVGEDGEEEDGNEMLEVEDDGNADDEDAQPDGGNAAASDDLVCETGANNEGKKSQTDACELANKLQENAQHIHMLLKEEAGENENHNLAISSDSMETTRQKGDELIKSLGGLVSYLNQFTDLIKENGFENVVGMS